MALRYNICRIANFMRNIRHYSNSRKYVDVSVNNKSGIATVTMQRPTVNALNLELLTELSTLFTELEHNKIRGMVLTSLFDKKAFSAGLDFNELYKQNYEHLRIFWKTVQDVLINLYGTSYPTVAVINGHAPAGGCMLAVCCEYRIMLNNFTIGLNETQVGLFVPIWLGLAMQNTIGKRKTEFASTTSTLFTTDEALKMGLIDETASDKSEAMDKAVKFLSQFEKISSTARATTKKYLRGPDLQIMQKTGQEDLDSAVSLIMKPEFQQRIEYQLTKLKNKKRI